MRHAPQGRLRCVVAIGCHDHEGVRAAASRLGHQLIGRADADLRLYRLHALLAQVRFERRERLCRLVAPQFVGVAEGRVHDMKQRHATDAACRQAAEQPLGHTRAR